MSSGQMSDIPIPARPARLKFIDLARAIAILLMLEGHFVGLALADMDSYRGNPVFQIWSSIRGFTAPLFFTVAGMIFCYLLSGETEGNFLKRVRVRKGFKRAMELLFWGYVLQLSLKNFGNYIKGDFGDWVYAFHVLQCIGLGLIALIGLAGIQSKLKSPSLAWWYVGAIFVCMAFYLWLKSLPEGTYVPAGFPQIIQNTISGPYSVFAIAPWLGFAFLGGAIGVTVRKYRSHLDTAKSCLWFFAVAAFLKLIWVVAVTVAPSEGLAWFTARSAQVVAFLGLLRWVEVRFGIAVPRMLCVGRMTFEIYIVHVVVLYGGIFGFGLKAWIANALNPWQVTAGAAVFVTVFFWFAQAVDAWKKRRMERGL